MANKPLRNLFGVEMVSNGFLTKSTGKSDGLKREKPLFFLKSLPTDKLLHGAQVNLRALVLDRRFNQSRQQQTADTSAAMGLVYKHRFEDDIALRQLDHSNSANHL